MINFTGKTAMITGASSGIGRQTAITLASLGADIAIVYVGPKDPADKVVEEISTLGRKAVAYECDVSDWDSAKATVKAAIKEFGGIDILVNNAGITRDGLALSMKDSDWDAVLNVNLKGAFNMIKACYSGFIRRRSGKIINISSVSGMMGNAGQANYSASKAGLIGLTKTIARELAERNINCNAVAPGFVATNMTANITDNNALLQSIPKRRMGKPEDIANAVAFLASDAADYITGEVLRVDGGLAM
jgi:3-oxoacyl-[acyl-carrier protein] reductase